MKKNDKTQGVVFVLPNSREFFGRINKDFEKTGVETDIIDTETLFEEEMEDAQDEVQGLSELKENLDELSKLHARLKGLLAQINNLVEEDQ